MFGVPDRNKYTIPRSTRGLCVPSAGVKRRPWARAPSAQHAAFQTMPRRPTTRNALDPSTAGRASVKKPQLQLLSKRRRRASLERAESEAGSTQSQGPGSAQSPTFLFRLPLLGGMESFRALQKVTFPVLFFPP